MDQGLIERLKKTVGADHLILDDALKEPYSHDATFATRTPDLVVVPGSTEQVAAVVAALAGAGVSITARGAGTGLSGGAVAIEGGAVLSLKRLNKIEIDAASMCAVVGAGAITGDLQDEAAKYGLAYPPDPASLGSCTIGGNIATNAGGPSCLKYGVTAEYVLGLTVVLADGRVLRLGGKTRKRSSGYRLSQLFVGSEGTLGIVTEAILRLIPRPRQRATLIAAFSSVEAAAVAVTAVLTGGHLPAACELIDKSSLEFVEDLLPAGFPTDAEAVLLIEQDGNDPHALGSEMKELAGLARSEGAFEITDDFDNAGVDLWAARRSIGLRLIERRAFRVPEDIAVPLAEIPKTVQAIRSISDELGIAVALFGHAGDGNLHPSLIFDDRDPQTLRRVGEAASRIFRAAISSGGTVSAEHGLGAIKRDFSAEDLGEEALRLMQGLKTLLDPEGLLNPGKMFPTRAPAPGFMESIPGWVE